MKTFHFVIRIVVITCWLMWAMISLTCAQVDDLKNISDRVGLGSIYQQRPPAKNTAVYPRHGLNADTSSFYRQRLYAPGEYGSANWRIPAILALSDGSLLAVNDKRKFNEGDLPQDIDIVARRSTDNGRTWSEPVTIAAGKGVKKGFGDPALVETETSEVICAFAGGNGYFQSTEEDPIRLFVSRSLDGGKTWSKPEDITFQIWGTKALNPDCRKYRGSFFSSGNGLRLTRGLHKGRIMFAVPMLRKDEWVSDNFVVYSDDSGRSWQVSECAFKGGDEAKLVELVDGRVLLSTRQSGPRGYNISDDGGVHWSTQGYWPEMTTNACNGDIIRLSATDRGERNVLMHSIPNSMDREHVTIFFSYDEGKTWQDPLLLFNGPSVYSSLTVLIDGSVGAYIEQNPNGACELWFIQIPKKR
ncbi:MAG: exo-alpha-sialidase [Bacteroidales bacterium]|nr:exo-alpha-sialidase [Bacteroidales bacterium]